MRKKHLTQQKEEHCHQRLLQNNPRLANTGNTKEFLKNALKLANTKEFLKTYVKAQKMQGSFAFSN